MGKSMPPGIASETDDAVSQSPVDCGHSLAFYWTTCPHALRDSSDAHATALNMKEQCRGIHHTDMETLCVIPNMPLAISSIPSALPAAPPYPTSHNTSRFNFRHCTDRWLLRKHLPLCVLLTKNIKLSAIFNFAHHAHPAQHKNTHFQKKIK